MPRKPMLMATVWAMPAIFARLILMMAPKIVIWTVRVMLVIIVQVYRMLIKVIRIVMVLVMPAITALPMLTPIKRIAIMMV